jgi:hypothetical protein
MALTKVTYAMLDGEVINVLDYGADSTGAVDSTVAIQTAINLANTNGGGTVLIPPGNYLVDAVATVTIDAQVWNYALLAKTNVTLQLIGNINLKGNNFDRYSVILANNINSFNVEGNGTITGDKLTHTVITGEFGHGIAVRGSSNISVSGITITNCWGDGMYTSIANSIRSQNIVVRDCSFLYNRRHNVTVIEGSNILVSNCILLKNDVNVSYGGFAIDLEQNNNTQIIDNVTLDNLTINNGINGITASSGSTGIGVVGSGPTSNVKVQNCYIKNCGYGGVRVTNDSSDVIVDGNVFENIDAYFAIDFDGSTKVIATNNSVTNALRLIYLNDCDDFKICLNTAVFDPSESIGIVVDGTSTNGVIYGNNLDGYGSLGTATLNGSISVLATGICNLAIDSNVIKNSISTGIRANTIDESSINIVNNLITDCAEYGIRASGYGVLIANNNLIANGTTGSEGNIYIASGIYPTVVNNRIRVGSGTSPLGIRVAGVGVIGVFLMGNDAYTGGVTAGIPTGAAVLNGGNRNNDGTFSTTGN